MYILLSLHQCTTDTIAHYMYIHITLLLCNLIPVYLQNFIAMKILLTIQLTHLEFFKKEKKFFHILQLNLFLITG